MSKGVRSILARFGRRVNHRPARPVYRVSPAAGRLVVGWPE